jgi:hypothetical protein
MNKTELLDQIDFESKICSNNLNPVRKKVLGKRMGKSIKHTPLPFYLEEVKAPHTHAHYFPITKEVGYSSKDNTTLQNTAS